jgi:hypothetical protein
VDFWTKRDGEGGIRLEILFQECGIKRYGTDATLLEMRR